MGNLVTRCLSSFALMLTAFHAAAQGEPADSLAVGSPDATSVAAPALMPVTSVEAPGLNIPATGAAAPSAAVPGVMPASPARIIEFKAGLRSPGTIAQWGSGGVAGAMEHVDLRGLMGIERGSIGMTQTFGPVTLTAYGEAVKYAWFRGMSRSLGFGGSLSYRFSDRLSLTLFGSYHTNPGPMSPAMMGYVSIPSFGGYFDYAFSDRWGVKVGAQSYRSMVTGRWEAQPIVTPYYRISRNSTIGVDVGGILYHLIRGASGGSWGGQRNPTMRPDIPGPPPIAPRR